MGVKAGNKISGRRGYPRNPYRFERQHVNGCAGCISAAVALAVVVEVIQVSMLTFPSGCSPDGCAADG